MTVAIIAIATGGYIKFFGRLRETILKHFLTGHKLHFFVLTDDARDFGPDVTCVHMDQMPWPLPSLLRFDMFRRLPLKQYDLAYYFDVDQLVVGDIGEEVIPPADKLVGVIHPANATMTKPQVLEQRPESAAYCDPDAVRWYFHANFFGGWTDRFIHMLETCSKSVAKDLAASIIAKWHDESHLNRYFLTYPPVALGEAYGWPSCDSADLAGKKILHMAKDFDALRWTVERKAEVSRGVCLLAAGDRCYGEYAYNLAASIVHREPGARITLFADDSAVVTLTDEQRKVFEAILPIPAHALEYKGTRYYNRFKLFLAEVSPYDHTMYFDADSMWTSTMGIHHLFDFMLVHKAEIGGQCEAIVPVNDEAELFKMCVGVRPTQDFTPPLTFVGENFYQIHGQFIYCRKTEKAKATMAVAARLFDSLADGSLNCKKYWVWHGQPIEELCLTLATAITGIELPQHVNKMAPVSVQSDNLDRIDPYSTKRFMISINGYATQEEAARVHGYCMGEEVTARYIRFYNEKADELKAAGFHTSHYLPKVVKL